MSVVAVKIEKDKITMGADSIVCRGITQSKNTKAKLFKVSNNFGVGGTGFLREISLLFLFSKTHTPANATQEGIIEFFDEYYDWVKKKTDVLPSSDTSYTVVYNGKAFVFEDFAVFEVTDFYAMGAGRDYAITALYLKKSVEQAIEVSCELCVYCEEPINIFEFSTKGI